MSAMNLDGGVVASALETLVRKRRVRKGMGTIVDDIMTREPITIRADDTLEHRDRADGQEQDQAARRHRRRSTASTASSRAPTW